MKDRKTIISIVLSLIAICTSVAAIVICLTKEPKEAPAPAAPAVSTEAATEDKGDVQYVLYLGTNDKDTNEPIFSPEESKAKLKEILINQMGGYTIQEASGGWKGDDGKEYQEYTLVIYLSDTDLDKVHTLCDELIKTYDQSAILIQMNNTRTEFYSTAGN